MFREVKAMEKDCKVWVDRWTDLAKKAKKWATSLRSANLEGLLASLKSIAKSSAAGGPLAKLLGDVCELQEVLSKMRTCLADDTLKLLVEPIEGYVKTVVGPAKDEASRVRKLQKLVDEKGVKYRILCERQQTDKAWIAQCLESSHALWEARHRLRTGMRRAHAKLTAVTEGKEAVRTLLQFLLFVLFCWSC
jgi:hypothetical protein